MLIPSPRVKESGPTESQSLQEQVEMLQGLLESVQKQVAQQAQAQAQRRARQSFLQESRRLLLWVEGVQAQLHNKEKVVDVTSAQRLLEEHRDLLEEIHLLQERSGQENRQGALRAGHGLWGQATRKGEAGNSASPKGWPRLVFNMILEAGFRGGKV